MLDKQLTIYHLNKVSLNIAQRLEISDQKGVDGSQIHDIPGKLRESFDHVFHPNVITLTLISILLSMFVSIESIDVMHNLFKDCFLLCLKSFYFQVF